MAAPSWNELRRRAEDEVGMRPRPPSWSTDHPRVLYELEVHQVELRMQHDELQRTRVELERALEDYRALFEDAPVAYVELDERTFVRRANRAAVELFALTEAPPVRRKGALGGPLASTLSADCADALQRHLMHAVRSGERASCVLDLVVLGNPPLRVRLDTEPVVSGGAQLCRTVVTELPVVATVPAALPEPRTVWVVDDEPGVRRLVARTLRSAGYRVVVKEAGGEVIEALSDEGVPMDLLLTDVVMPGIGGVELAAEVRRRRPGTPVLFMSGNVGDQRLPEGDRLVPKPFSVEALRAEIEALLAGE